MKYLNKAWKLWPGRVSDAEQGVRIYVVDSGILKTHTEFQFPVAEGSVNSTVSYGKDIDDDDDISEDCEGHGSHVAGNLLSSNQHCGPESCV